MVGLAQDAQRRCTRHFTILPCPEADPGYRAAKLSNVQTAPVAGPMMRHQILFWRSPMIEDQALDRVQARLERIVAQRQFIAFQNEVLGRIVAAARGVQTEPQVIAEPAGDALARTPQDAA